MLRGRGHVSEAVCAGASQRLDREFRADALLLSVVCDFDRHLGCVRLVWQLHISGSGDE